MSQPRRTARSDHSRRARPGARAALLAVLLAGLPAGGAVAAPPAEPTPSGHVSRASYQTVTGLVVTGWRTWPPGSPNAYPIEAIATVDVYESLEPANGTVAFYLNGAQLGEEVAVDAEGTARMSMPTDQVGTYQVFARYTGTATQAPSVSRTLDYRVDPAITPPPGHAQGAAVASSVKARISPAPGRRVRVKVVVSASRPATGRVEVRDGSKVVASGTITAAGTVKLRTRKLARGTHRLKVRYLGSTTVSASGRTYRVTVR
ncbi:Ig-like domain-containing protein [Nocardioides nitrophenolicus]|uniref:Ig-like domain-containing protein n=1 Tax=Nocardioides nitrophenolicus TaxID=60489 RepID=UPI00195D2090|nr:Ig-like domain-containing protein [Nocardioides nitrophenolicus]MBM7516261.1 hypothetical protein [Nocardioides nitrophenolicus]